MQIGNAAINDGTDNNGMIDFFASHALISLESSRDIHKYCNFSADAETSDECIKSVQEAGNMVGTIDIYNIYYPMCLHSNLTSIPKPFSVSFLFCFWYWTLLFSGLFGSDSTILYNRTG